MNVKSAALAAAMLAALALAGCNESNGNALQGWVEADFVFVSPDEQGRVEQLKVHEGDHVKKDQLLFTVDDDLQAADVKVKEACRSSSTVNSSWSFFRRDHPHRAPSDCWSAALLVQARTDTKSASTQPCSAFPCFVAARRVRAPPASPPPEQTS